jgi:hypothetical protein
MPLKSRDRLQEQQQERNRQQHFWHQDVWLLVGAADSAYRDRDFGSVKCPEVLLQRAERVHKELPPGQPAWGGWLWVSVQGMDGRGDPHARQAGHRDDCCGEEAQARQFPRAQGMAGGCLSVSVNQIL